MYVSLNIAKASFNSSLFWFMLDPVITPIKAGEVTLCAIKILLSTVLFRMSNCLSKSDGCMFVIKGSLLLLSEKTNITPPALSVPLNFLFNFCSIFFCSSGVGSPLKKLIIVEPVKPLRKLLTWKLAI